MEMISGVESREFLEGQIVLDQGEKRTMMVRHFGVSKIVVGENAELNLLLMGGSLDQAAKLEVNLTGRGARAIVRGIFSLESGVEASTIVMSHEANETISDCRLRSLVMNNARFDVKGIVQIPEGSVDAETYFSSHVIVVGGGHVGNTPSMEIRERRVKAGHAASVSALDPEDFFYAQSRGISSDGVMRMMARGFIFSDLAVESPFYEIANKTMDCGILKDE